MIRAGPGKSIAGEKNTLDFSLRESAHDTKASGEGAREIISFLCTEIHHYQRRRRTVRLLVVERERDRQRERDRCSCVETEVVEKLDTLKHWFRCGPYTHTHHPPACRSILFTRHIIDEANNRQAENHAVTTIPKKRNC